MNAGVGVALSAVVNVTSGSLSGMARELIPDEDLVIGRAPPEGLSIADDLRLSREHFRLRLTSDGVLIEDLRSRNGVLVDGEPLVGSTVIHGAARIQAGRTTLEVIVSDFPTIMPDSQLEAPENIVHERLTVEGPTGRPSDWVFALLSAAREPVFALYDALADDELASLLEKASDKAKAALDIDYPFSRPIILSFRKDSTVCRRLVDLAWGRGLGVFFTSNAAPDAVLTHVRRLLVIRDQNGDAHLLRLAEPRSLETVLKHWPIARREEFFGPIKRFLHETEDPTKIRSIKLSGSELVISDRPVRSLASS